MQTILRFIVRPWKTLRAWYVFGRADTVLGLSGFQAPSGPWTRVAYRVGQRRGRRILAQAAAPRGWDSTS